GGPDGLVHTRLPRTQRHGGPDGRPCNGRGGRSGHKLNPEAEAGSTRRPDAVLKRPERRRLGRSGSGWTPFTPCPVLAGGPETQPPDPRPPRRAPPAPRRTAPPHQPARWPARHTAAPRRDGGWRT